jgi:hypothetical protein
MSGTELMGAFWFLLSTILALAISFGAAFLSFGPRTPWKTLLGTVAGFPLVAVSAVLVTGVSGVLAVQWIALFLAGVILCAWLFPGVRTALRRAIHLDGPAEPHGRSALDPLQAGLAIALTIAFVGVPMARSLVAGPNFGSDDFSYHAPSITEWMLHGQIVLAPYDYHSYYPFNAEALATWVVLPFHRDGLVGLTGAYWLVLLWLATIQLVIVLGGSRFHGVIAGALVIASPLVSSMATRFSSPDVAGVAMILTAVTFLAPDPGRTPSISRSSSVYAGLLLGFALGCKVSYGLPLAIVLGWTLFSSRVAPSYSARARLTAVVLACGFITGAFWYLRNWSLTGNPLFPAQAGPFAGPFTQADQARTKLITWILERPTDLQQWSFILRTMVDWPPSLFALSLFGYLGASWGLVRSRLRKQKNPLQILLIVIGLGVALVFVFLPFSGTDNEPGGALDPKTRFIILTYVLGVILFCTMPAKTVRRQTIMMAVAILAIIPAWAANPWIGLSIVLASFLYPLTGSIWQRVSGSVRLHKMSWILGVTGSVLVGLVLIQPVAQYLTDQRVFKYGLPESPIGQAWQAMESLPAGSRIGWFTNKPQEYYPLFGRALNKIPVPLDPNGVRYRPLHIISAETRSMLSWWGGEATPEVSRFAENIRRTGIDFVLVSKWGGQDWPPQQDILRKSAGILPVYEDGHSTIWKILPAGTPSQP